MLNSDVKMSEPTQNKTVNLNRKKETNGRVVIERISEDGEVRVKEIDLGWRKVTRMGNRGFITFPSAIAREIVGKWVQIKVLYVEPLSTSKAAR